MKKFLYSTVLLSACIFASCDDNNLLGPKDEVGETATVALAGEWYVHANVVMGENVLEDPFGLGSFELLTYNTAANTSTEMYVNDGQGFWNFTGVVSCDTKALTFSGTDVQNEAYDCTFNVIDGKVLLGAATSPYGHKADSICFSVTFSDDTDGYTYRLEGYRRTGFDQGND